MSVQETPGDQRNPDPQEAAAEQTTQSPAETADDGQVAAADGTPDIDGDDPVDEMTALTGELEKAQKLAASHWDRLLRMQAEMDNQQKRARKELENARKFAVEALINDLLPVKDSLEMGIAAARAEDADPAKIIEGTDLTLKMFEQTFEKYKIVEIDPMDQKFDPEFHQAMSMQEVEGVAGNTVVNVLQKGYTLNDRLIRPAMVIVAK